MLQSSDLLINHQMLQSSDRIIIRYFFRCFSIIRFFLPTIRWYLSSIRCFNHQLLRSSDFSIIRFFQSSDVAIDDFFLQTTVKTFIWWLFLCWAGKLRLAQWVGPLSDWAKAAVDRRETRGLTMVKNSTDIFHAALRLFNNRRSPCKTPNILTS